MKRYLVLVSTPTWTATFKVEALNTRQAEWIAGIRWPMARLVQVRD